MEVYDKLVLINNLLINGEGEKVSDVIGDEGELLFKYIYSTLLSRFDYQKDEIKDFLRKCNYEKVDNPKLNINYEAVASFVYSRIMKKVFPMPKGPYKTTCFVHRKAFIKYQDKYRCFFSMPEGKYSGFIYTVYSDYTTPIKITEKDLGFMFVIPESGEKLYSKEKGNLILSPTEFFSEVHLKLEDKYKYEYFLIDGKQLEFERLDKAYIRLNNVYIGEFNIKKMGLNTIYAEKKDIPVVNIYSGDEYLVASENMNKFLKTGECLVLGEKTGKGNFVSINSDVSIKRHLKYIMLSSNNVDTFVPKCLLDRGILLPTNFNHIMYENGDRKKLDTGKFFSVNERIQTINTESFEEKINNNLLSGFGEILKEKVGEEIWK